MDSATLFVRENYVILVGAGLAIAALLGTYYYLLPMKADRKVLSKSEYRKFPLIDKRVVSHNTRKFRFGLPRPKDRLGLPLGWHLSLRAFVDGSETRRPYTPISSEDDLGFFELMIKVYPEPYGKMSRYLDAMQIGDEIDVKGPIGKFCYARNTYKKVCMIAGGTGITPMWQVFQAILKDPADRTEINLIFANVTEDDILLRDQLDTMANELARFTVYYVLNNPPPGWRGGVGFVSEDHIRERFGPVDPDFLYCICGPPPMTKAMRKHLTSIGCKDSQIQKF